LEEEVTVKRQKRKAPWASVSAPGANESSYFRRDLTRFSQQSTACGTLLEIFFILWMNIYQNLYN
jgi:hypothetical protein